VSQLSGGGAENAHAAREGSRTGADDDAAAQPGGRVTAAPTCDQEGQSAEPDDMDRKRAEGAAVTGLSRSTAAALWDRSPIDVSQGAVQTGYSQAD
jgi:hypothetical protein